MPTHVSVVLLWWTGKSKPARNLVWQESLSFNDLFTPKSQSTANQRRHSFDVLVSNFLLMRKKWSTKSKKTHHVCFPCPSTVHHSCSKTVSCTKLVRQIFSDPQFTDWRDFSLLDQPSNILADSDEDTKEAHPEYRTSSLGDLIVQCSQQIIPSQSLFCSRLFSVFARRDSQNDHLFHSSILPEFHHWTLWWECQNCSLSHGNWERSCLVCSTRKWSVSIQLCCGVMSVTMCCVSEPSAILLRDLMNGFVCPKNLRPLNVKNAMNMQLSIGQEVITISNLEMMRMWRFVVNTAKNFTKNVENLVLESESSQEWQTDSCR